MYCLVCVSVRHTCAMAHVWRSKNNLGYRSSLSILFETNSLLFASSAPC